MTDATDKDQAKDESSKIAALEAKIDALSKLLDKGQGEDKDLKNKVEDDKAKKETDQARDREIENAALFVNDKTFADDTAGLLGENTAAIFEKAKTENYGSTLERANDLRASLIEDAFSIQENLDQLTPSQRAKIESFNKSTRPKKQELAGSLFCEILEPFIQLQKAKAKAEEVRKAAGGLGTKTSDEQEYEKKLVDHARKNYKLDK
jgi:hypothetical protein